MVVMGMGIRMCMCMFMPSIVQHVTTYARTIVQLNIFPVSQESVQAVRERVPYCVARDESSTSALYVLYIYVPTTYCTRYARRTVEESGGGSSSSKLRLEQRGTRTGMYLLRCYTYFAQVT